MNDDILLTLVFWIYMKPSSDVQNAECFDVRDTSGL
jgi:hypothetical protein